MADLAKIKAQLEAKLEELNARAHEIDDDLSEPHNADWSENAVESEQDEVLEEMGTLAVAEIKRIEGALSKIEAGTYGICEKCHEQIPLKRMEALPYATTCVNCA